MYASVLRFESNTKDLEEIEALFEKSLIPEMRLQNGYEGCYFLRASKTQGLAVTLWESKDALEANNQNEAFSTILRSFVEDLGSEVRMKPYQVRYADHQMHP